MNNFYLFLIDFFFSFTVMMESTLSVVPKTSTFTCGRRTMIMPSFLQLAGTVMITGKLLKVITTEWLCSRCAVSLLCVCGISSI